MKGEDREYCLLDAQRNLARLDSALAPKASPFVDQMRISLETTG
jgi:hypothetical protein